MDDEMELDRLELQALEDKIDLLCAKLYDSYAQERDFFIRWENQLYANRVREDAILTRLEEYISTISKSVETQAIVCNLDESQVAGHAHEVFDEIPKQAQECDIVDEKDMEYEDAPQMFAEMLEETVPPIGVVLGFDAWTNTLSNGVHSSPCHYPSAIDLRDSTGGRLSWYCELKSETVKPMHMGSDLKTEEATKDDYIGIGAIAEFASVRHQLKVLDDRLDEMVPLVAPGDENFVNKLSSTTDLEQRKKKCITRDMHKFPADEFSSFDSDSELRTGNGLFSDVDYGCYECKLDSLDEESMECKVTALDDVQISEGIEWSFDAAVTHASDKYSCSSDKIPVNKSSNSDEGSCNCMLKLTAMTRITGSSASTESNETQLPSSIGIPLEFIDSSDDEALSWTNNRTIDTEFAIVRHLIKVLEDWIADRVQPVNPVDVFDVFQPLNPGVAAAWLDRCDRTHSLRYSVCGASNSTMGCDSSSATIVIILWWPINLDVSINECSVGSKLFVERTPVDVSSDEDESWASLFRFPSTPLPEFEDNGGEVNCCVSYSYCPTFEDMVKFIDNKNFHHTSRTIWQNFLYKYELYWQWPNNINEILMLVFPDAGSADGTKECFNEVQLVFSLLWTGLAAILIYILSLYWIALGTSGIKSYVSFLGADQFENIGPIERLKKGSFFNGFYFLVYMGTPTSSSWLVWVQDNCCSGLGFGFPTLIMGKAMESFFCGTPLCRFRRPRGSPLLRACQVVVASVRKWNVPVPIDCSLLHELQISTIEGSLNMEHSDDLNPLDEAATLSDSDVKTEDFNNPWGVCTVTLVEELKTLGMDMSTTGEIAIPIARKFTGKKIGPTRPPPALDEVQSLIFANCPLLHSVPLVLSGVLVAAGWPWLVAWKLPPAPNLATLQC